MTKIEYKMCEKLMYDAISLAKKSEEEFKNVREMQKQENSLWETEQRKADQHYGEALGAHQALVRIGFKHERMTELGKIV